MLQHGLRRKLKEEYYATKRYHYDSECDILECVFGNQKNSYGDEEPDNIVLFRDINTDEITGVKVIDFKRMYNTNDFRLKFVNQFIDVEKIAKSILYN